MVVFVCVCVCVCVFKLSAFHKVQWLHFTSEVDKSSDVTFLLDLVYQKLLKSVDV